MLSPNRVFPFLKKEDWLASIDLKDTYFHVPVNINPSQYLRFAFLDKVFQFKVLHFGLSTDPRLFTKMFAAIIGLVHLEAIQIYLYLDECLIVARSKDMLLSSLQLSLDMLRDVGFLFNDT